MAKKKTSKKKAAAAPMESLVVGSKVKAAIKAHGLNSSGDVLDAVNGYIHWLVGQAAKRAAANGRKTVRGHDIIIME
jgi:histone H3/H4